jgi:hypothetical protein
VQLVKSLVYSSPVDDVATFRTRIVAGLQTGQELGIAFGWGGNETYGTFAVRSCEDLSGIATGSEGNWLTDGGKLVSLTHRPRSTSQKHFLYCWCQFLLEAE